MTPRRKTAAAVAVLAILVVVYNVTHGQNVPSWLDLHVQRNVQSAYHWVTQNTGRNWFLILTKSVGDGLGWAVRQVVHVLRWMRWTGVVTLTAVIGYLRSGWRTAVIGGLMMFAVGLCGFWDKAMITLAIMLVAVAMSMVVGVPLGIWSGLNDGVERRVRPLLDTAQVMPAFVYLIPIVSLFGIGFAPAVIATMVYAIPPAVRLTNLGIRQVPVVATEVGASYGSTTRQLLGKVQLPMARPAIALGLNQVIMMAFGIVVIASLLGTGDVGQEVLTGLQKQDVQRSFAAGFSIVFAAIALDRISTGHGAPLSERLPLWLRAPRRWMAASAGLVLLAAIVGKVLNLGEFVSWRLDVGDWAKTAVTWVNSHWRRGLPLIGGTESISDFLTLYVLSPVRDFLQGSAWWLIAAVAALLGWLARGWRLAAISAACFAGIAAMANWDLAMDTLSQVLVAVVLSMMLAVPIGIWAGRSRWAGRVLRPMLDTAQVLPQFVYLVPVIFLFNVGRVPGLIASVIYGIPPGIRLVSLGLSEVPVAPREAAVSYGATPRQELLKVQLPLALKSIMLGVNQVILMVLATVIIAGLIGAGALGLEAVSGFTKPNLKLGDGAAAGASIVLLAVFLDRLTQAWGRRFDYSHGHS